MGCLFVLFSLITPRFVLVILWLFTDYLATAFGSWFWPTVHPRGRDHGRGRGRDRGRRRGRPRAARRQRALSPLELTYGVGDHVTEEPAAAT
jgi:hypothetical protein